MVSIMDCGPTPSQQAGQQIEQQQEQQQNQLNDTDNRPMPPKSAVSQRSIDLKISQKDIDTELTKKNLKLDLVQAATKELDQFSIKSPRSPLVATIRQGTLPHQTSLTSQTDLVEDRKTLRDALYQGIFHRHRRTIFALGSFLRMLKSRNSQYNTIRSSSEGEDIDESR